MLFLFFWGRFGRFLEYFCLLLDVIGDSELSDVLVGLFIWRYKGW